MKHILEICPQGQGIGIMLMNRHIAHGTLRAAQSGLMLCHPFQGLLQEILTYRRTRHQILSQAVSSTIALGEMQLGITHKGACIYSITYLLLVERLACNIDCLEPLQLLRLFSLAHIYRQLVI